MIIDKSHVLKAGLEKFPSIFIEGAAVIGKTTAVNMLLEAHPEATSDVFNMNKKIDIDAFSHRLKQASAKTKGERFLVFENITDKTPKKVQEMMAELVESLPKESKTKVIFVSRQKPSMPMLKLMWKGKLGMIYPSSLMFTQGEVTKYVREYSTSMVPADVYRVTGGWPGCVAMIMNMASQLQNENSSDRLTVDKIFSRYEVQAYIQNELLLGLADEEQKVLNLAACCPWVNEENCHVVWDINNPKETLLDLERKGFLAYNDIKNHWKASPVITVVTESSRDAKLDVDMAVKLGKWYQSKGAVEEALWCFKTYGVDEEYRRCVINNFHIVGFEELMHCNLLDWKPEPLDKISSVEYSIRLCYLRGMHLYLNGDLQGFGAEIERIKKLEQKAKGHPEEKSAAIVHLNLAYADAGTSIEQWLDLLEDRKQWGPVRLYHLTENTDDFLTGYRDLSTLYICSLKEKKRRTELLRSYLGEKEWMAIKLGYLSFEHELGKKTIAELSQWSSMLKVVSNHEAYSWRFKMICFCLLNKLYLTTQDTEVLAQLKMLENLLAKEENPACASYLQAVYNIYALRGSSDSSATRWLKAASTDTSFAINESNYQIVFLMVKGLLAMNQPEIAGRILRKLVPYLQKYSRNSLLAEAMFQKAIVEWADGKEGAAVRSAVESFLYAGKARYVTFYGAYGQRGYEVLKAYVDWLRNVEPEKWQGKKRYNYGNVLSMPMEDYLEVLLRQSKRTASMPSNDHMVEKLTLMETVILQNIYKGMSNQEICEELNLKLPTVKTHISNLYKKLGAESRVQAIVRGKEIGILK